MGLGLLGWDRCLPSVLHGGGSVYNFSSSRSIAALRYLLSSLVLLIVQVICMFCASCLFCAFLLNEKTV